MKRFLLCALLAVATSGLVRAAAPEDLYIAIFNLIVKGDELQEKGQGRGALEKYLEAERDLKKLKSAYSSWNSRIVDFRLKYLAKQIGPLKVQYPGTSIPQGVLDTGRKGKGGKNRNQAKGGSKAENTALRQLNEQLIQTSRAKTQLEEKLREALAARPADVDPGAYAQAQERIRMLEQSEDVKAVTLERSESELNRLRSEYEALQRRYQAAATRSQEEKLRNENAELRRHVREMENTMRGAANADELKRQVALLQTDLQAAEQRARALQSQNQSISTQLQSANLTQLRSDNDALKNQVKALSKIASEVGNMEQVSQRLRQMEEELSAQRNMASALSREKQQLESQLASANVPALKAENQALKSEVSKLNEIASTMPKVDKLQSELAAAKAKVQTEQSLRASLAREKQKLENLLTDPNLSLGGSGPELKALQKENAALQSELQKLNNEVQKNSAQSARVRALEVERERLQRELQDAMKSLEAQKKTAVTPSADSPELKKKLAVAEARIAALESTPAPYTPQELALLKKPAAPEKLPEQPKREFPASAAQIALQAQRAYNARRYDEAEQKYKEILSLEENNVFTLANLAAAQMELNKLTEAESNLTKALAIHGDDAFSLSLMGLVNFRQGDYDIALDMLSRAAVLNPDNAQTQNYLGLALSQKGLRIAAEAAFRKAVKLAPGYSVAHYNLAVFYATAKSPSPELAKWHYQKALAAGHPKSAELENMLASR